MPALKRALARLRAITWGGVLLGVLLVTGLALMLVNDHHRRLEAAQRQSRALAVGSERLLALELRNLERAMTGIAADAAELFSVRQAPALLDASIGGVLRRHAELHSIVVLDSYGRALTAGKGDLQLPCGPIRNGGSAARCTSAHHSAPATGLGGPAGAADGRWALAAGTAALWRTAAHRRRPGCRSQRIGLDQRCPGLHAGPRTRSAWHGGPPL